MKSLRVSFRLAGAAGASGSSSQSPLLSANCSDARSGINHFSGYRNAPCLWRTSSRDGAARHENRCDSRSLRRTSFGGFAIPWSSRREPFPPSWLGPVRSLPHGFARVGRLFRRRAWMLSVRQTSHFSMNDSALSDLESRLFIPFRRFTRYPSSRGRSRVDWPQERLLRRRLPQRRAPVSAGKCGC